MRRAGRLLCGWLDGHLTAFLPGPADATRSFDQLKRLSEISLVLLALTCSGGQPENGSYARWASRSAGHLRAGLEARNAELLPVIAGARSSAGRAMLLAYPALEALTGQRLSCHDLILRSLATGPGADLNLAFARDVAGLSDCRPDVAMALDKAIRKSRVVPEAGTAQAVYDLTHLAFYATCMGRRPAGWATTDTAWVHAQLDRATIRFLARRELDVTAEAVAALLMTGAAPSRAVHDAVGALDAAATADGSVPAHPRHHDEAADTFGNRYHPTLTSLAALAVAEMRGVTGPPAPRRTR
jgi:hypothetical protein